MRTFIAALAALAVLAAPALASANGASIAFRSLSGAPGGDRVVSVSSFDLVGLRWRGPGSVRLQVRSVDGSWSAWLDGTGEAGDRPDTGSREGVTSASWHLGSPIWVGPSNAIRVRTGGRVTDLRASFVRSPGRMVPLRSLAVADAPAIVPRSAWGADESIRRRAPEYAPSIRFATVHHTAGRNDYSRAEAPAIMRAIQLYHVESNGWNDIGYNFLVDRYGTVYEGRHGGIDQNVVGAHARGFNDGSVGVAVLGTFGTAPLPAAAARSLERLLAWRLDLAHVDPEAEVTVVSGGSERYLPGVPVSLRTISGHRDTGQTTCPGAALYARIGAIAIRTRALGLPKIFDPVVSGGLGGDVRFQARLSSALAWRVVVVDALGAELGVGEGRGGAVDWTWDASLVVGTGIRWRIEVTGATPAAGAFAARATSGPLALKEVSASPRSISPNGDGVADAATIAYTTTATATVSVSLLDASGVVLADLVPPTRQTSGRHTFAFGGAAQPDGVYRIVITATDTRGSFVSAELAIVVTRTLERPSLAPAVLTPNGDGKGDRLRVEFALAAPAAVSVRVLRDGKWVATLTSGAREAGRQTVVWDGRRRGGSPPDGQYAAVIEVTDAVGTGSATLLFVRDANPPRLRLVPRPPRLWVSEAATVTVRVNGSARRHLVRASGHLRLTGVESVRTLVATARDPAGNRSSVLRYPSSAGKDAAGQ